jgi:mono/diheme cytochrome c family protein
MRRLELALILSGVFAFTACGSSTPAGTGKGGSDGGAGHGGSGGAGTSGGGTGGGGTGGATTDGGDAATDMATSETGDAPTDTGLTLQATRGQYLVNGVLGCPGCHTPKAVDGGAVGLLSGVECFAKDSGGGCLNSANLTADDTGIGSLSDQQISDAITKGIFPAQVDGGTAYLFANMPYYQFANLTASDTAAIVAYLRSLPHVLHVVPANTGTFATRPTAAQWTPATLASLPSPVTPDAGADAGSDAGADGGSDAGAADGASEAGADAGAMGDPTNGKYVAALICSTCHTINTTAISPLQLDATKAYQGGKAFTTTVTVPVDAGTADGGSDAAADGGTDGGSDAATTMSVSKMIQSSNLTPDLTTGLGGWSVQQIVTTIKTAKDEAGRTTCSPMRAFAGLTDQDALDIATYLKSIQPATNAITLTCE